MDYNKKSEEYFGNVRVDLLSLLPKRTQNKKFLEIGAGNGNTISYLKEKRIASYVLGVDICKPKDLLNKNIDDFIVGDITKIDVKNHEKSFDYIILADVLEHVFEPALVLEKIKPLLKANGKLLISMPNIRHKSALFKVFLKGDFSYEESGIFDYTHLRFYCKKNIIKLIENSNYKINHVQSSIKVYQKKSISRLVNILTFGIFEEFLSVQYFVLAELK